MDASTEKYYLPIFRRKYKLPKEQIIQIMRDCEEMIDPEEFDWYVWECMVWDELKMATEL